MEAPRRTRVTRGGPAGPLAARLALRSAHGANTRSANPQSTQPRMRVRPRLLVSANGARPSSEVVVSRTLLRAAPQEPCSRRVETEPARRRAGGVEAPSGGGLTCLLRRAQLVRVRAEHAEVPAARGPSRRNCRTIEPLARVCRHRLRVTALWTSEHCPPKRLHRNRRRHGRGSAPSCHRCFRTGDSRASNVSHRSGRRERDSAQATRCVSSGGRSSAARPRH